MCVSCGGLSCLAAGRRIGVHEAHLKRTRSRSTCLGADLVGIIPVQLRRGIKKATLPVPIEDHAIYSAAPHVINFVMDMLSVVIVISRADDNVPIAAICSGITKPL